MKKAALIVMLCLCSWLRAADSHEPAAPGHPQTSAPHLVVSHDAKWAGVVIIIALGMFVMAAAIGATGDALAPEQPEEDTHHHDDHGHA